MLTLALLAACGSDPAPDAAPAPEPAEEAKSEQDRASLPPALPWEVRTHMHEHFAYATDALFYAFQGNVEKVQGEAKALAEHQMPADFPAEWKPHVDDMRKKAGNLATAKDMTAVSQGVVQLGQSCAACHSAVGGPDIPAKNVLKGADLFQGSAMERHQWAMYLMWLGMVGPSDEVWTLGTKALGHKAGDMPEIDPKVKGLDHRVHSLAAMGTKAKDPAERAEVFAQLVSTCSACHTQIGVEFTGLNPK